MKLRRFFFLAFAVLLLSCKPSSQASENSESRKIFRIEKYPCYGTCPHYFADIYSDGKIIFEGKNFVPVKGFDTLKIAKEEIKSLEEYAFEINFKDFNESYESQMTDLPTTITTWHYSDKENDKKSVKVYGAAPEELLKFQDRLNMLVLKAVKASPKAETTAPEE